MNRYISEREIIHKSGLSRVHLRSLRESGKFPQPINIPKTHYRYYEQKQVEKALQSLCMNSVETKKGDQ